VRFNGAVNQQVALEVELAQAVTVTALVEALTGEPIDAHDRQHSSTHARAGNLLGVRAGDVLLRRCAVLRGRNTGRAYLRVESTIVPGRLPEAFFSALEASHEPIGRILAREKIVFTRTPLAPPPPVSPLAPDGSDAPGDHLVARAYRMEVDDVPVMVVAEWFLAELGPFLQTR